MDQFLVIFLDHLGSVFSVGAISKLFIKILYRNLWISAFDPRSKYC